MSAATDPAKYREPLAAATVQATPVYTCAMHPEIRQTAPGVCPRCGMTLEVVAPATPATGIARPLQIGVGASVSLLVIYFGVVGLISGMDFAREQFIQYWYF